MTTTRLETKLERDQITPRLGSFPGVLLRVGLSAILTYLVGIAALAALFVGYIETTGCFMTCEEPNLLAGIPLLVLGGFLAILSLATVWWGLVDRYWRTVTRVLTALAIGSTILMIGLGLFV